MQPDDITTDMKIRHLQVTIAPNYLVEGSRCLAVEVRTECGKIFSSMSAVHEDSFQDAFGQLMKDAEYRIRQLVKEKTAPADNKL